MKIVLACPDGQWIEGRAKATAAVARLQPLGFHFKRVCRGGATWVQCGAPIEIEIETLEGFWALVQEINGPITLRDGIMIIEDINVEATPALASGPLEPGDPQSTAWGQITPEAG